MVDQLASILTIFAVVILLKYQNNLVRAYVLAFVAYFYIGWLFAKNMTFSQLAFYNTSIISLVFGITLASLILNELKRQNSSVLNSKQVVNEVKAFNPLVNLVLVLFITIAIVSYMLLIVIHGIPVLNISARDEVSGFFTYLIGLLWVTYPFIFVSLKKSYLKIATLVTIFVLLTMGYRTPLVVVILMFFVLNLKYKRFVFTKKAKAFSVLLLLSVVTIYPLLRFQEDPQAVVKLLANLNLPPELFIVAPFVLVFAEGGSVVLGITQVFPDVGAQWGKFTYAGFSTVLPGEQLHSRTLLSYWLGRTNWQDSTTTSTILGQFYLEGGRYFTYIMCGVLGFFLSWGSNKFLYKQSIFAGAPFLIIFVFLTISIHTGLLDPIILYVLFIYGVVALSHEIGVTVFTAKTKKF